MLDKNKYYIGDNMELITKLDDNSVDLVVTSPPYGKIRDYVSEDFDGYDFKGLAKELYRVIKQGGIVAWNEGDSKTNGTLNLTPYEHVIYFKNLGFRVHQILIYEKNGSPPHKNLYTDVVEYVYILSKGRPSTINLIEDRKNKWGGTESYGVTSKRNTDGTLIPKKKTTIKEYGRRTTIWHYAGGKFNGAKDEVTFNHPATMVDGLAIDLIQSYSNKGDLVLDPFAGSGTTLKMARILKRDYIGFELSDTYAPIIEERVNSDALLQKDLIRVEKYLEEKD